MNDALIIVICIFFMSIIWSFYFKKIREGVDNIDNYVMPISFSNNRSTTPGVDESKTIIVPEQIKSNTNLNLMNNTNVEGALNVKQNADIRGPLLVNGTTTLNQEIKIPKNVQMNFGAEQPKDWWAGKIYYETWANNDTLSIVGGGYGPRRVRIWDDLSVASNLNTGNNTTTNTLNVNSEAYVNSLNTNSLNVYDNGEIKMPKHVPMHFGVGQNKEGNAGKISYGSYGFDDSLCIVGGGQVPRKVKMWDELTVFGNATSNSLNVNGNATVKSLNVNENATVNSLNVKENATTDSLKINNSSNIKGIRIGWVAGRKGRVNFNPPFNGNFVVVTTTKSNREWNTQDGGNFYITIQVYNVSRNGFNFSQRSGAAEPGYKFSSGDTDFGFNWIAICADDAQF